MRALSRSPVQRTAGFTLIELLMGMVLATIVMGAVYQAIVGGQRITHAQVQRMDVQQTLRMASQYVGTRLRELDAYDGDLLFANANTLRFRAMQWTGFLCANPLAGVGFVTLPIRVQPLFGLRQPSSALDSILIFRDGNPQARADDRWLPGGLISATPGVCADGSVGIVLNVDVTAASGGTDSVVVGVTQGAPIRGFQAEELSLYADADGRWLGQRSATRGGAWSSVQPLIGPFQANGVQLAYFDSTDAVTGNPLQVASIELRALAHSRERARLSVSNTDYVRDSLVTRIALRNNRRF